MDRSNIYTMHAAKRNIIVISLRCSEVRLWLGRFGSADIANVVADERMVLIVVFIIHLKRVN